MITGDDFIQDCRNIRQKLTGKRRQEPQPLVDYALSQLPEGWAWASLSELCERVSVGHVGPTTEYFCDKSVGVPLIRSQNVRPGKLDIEGIAYITRKFHDSLKKSQLQSGDILFVRVGANRGDCCVVPENISEVNCANIVFARPFFPNNFFGLYFRSDFGQKLLMSVTTGAAQGVLNTTSIAALPVPVPPLEIQRKIASILSAYDDLIENNTRRIKILEEMARMIYREWFVNFRFPGNEQVRMVDSVLGMIPEGWEVKPVTESVEVNPRTKVPVEGEKTFVSMGSLSTESMLISDVESRSGNSGSKFKNGDTLFARITPCLENGKTGYVQLLPDAEATAFGSTEFIVLRSKTLCPEYVYLMARSSVFRDNAIKSMSGATGRQRVSEKCFEQFFIAQPEVATLEKFSGIAAQMFKQIQVIAKKNQNLRQTRDLLLPKLISGVVSLPTVEG